MQRDEAGFAEHSIQNADGLSLYVRAYGAGNPGTGARLPVICLPGLSRNSRDFHPLAVALSSPKSPADSARRVFCLDYRGRGLSDWDSDKSRYQLPIEAADVIAVCAALEISSAIFIGTSRGGLILHLLAAMKPDLLAGVILNDIGPVIEMQGLLHIREYLTPAPPPPSWPAAAERLKSMHGAVFPALSEADWLDMAKAIYREKNGQILPDFDPALVEPLQALDENTPIADLWPLFDGFKGMPLMAIRGAHSNILSSNTFAEMGARHPNMQAVTAPGQGHAPLLHLQPTLGAIDNFIAAMS